MADNTNPNPNPTETVAVAVIEEKPKIVVATEASTMTDKAVQMKNYSGLLSIITIILSLPILAAVIWLLYMKDYDCEKLLKLPKLQTGLGIGLIFVFLISNTAVFLRSRFPIPGFFIVMVPLIVVLTMGLALVGAYKMESRRIMATPMWFREKVRDDNNWRNIKSCIYSTELCEDLTLRSLSLKAYDFSMQKLSSVESGCCNPPGICEMEYVNATFWKKGDGVGENNNSHMQVRDCDTWKNNKTVLCYDCDSCKEGFVGILESKWSKLGVFLVLMAVLLILSHLLLFIAVMWERYYG